MLGAVAVLFSFQLAGEVIARFLGLPVPGPVIGLALFAALLALRPDLVPSVEGTARTILSHLSLLFVPAGVGVVANLDLLADKWVAICVVLVASTVTTLLVSVGTFLLVVRMTGGEDA
ncbi:CidA/LrgA family protein [Roseibium sp.]|uniref:CidA/LrgA family protein n=1 Tax=Roseibium sp. TaxID=1936156 RepID=UPI003266D76A